MIEGLSNPEASPNRYVSSLVRERLLRQATLKSYLQVRAHLQARSYKQWLMSSTTGAH